MAPVGRLFTTTIAAGALVGLPVWTAAHPDHHREGQQIGQERTAIHQQQDGDRQQAKQHLRQAAQALERIDDSSLQGEARTQVQQLRTHMAKLKQAYGVDKDKGERPGSTARTDMERPRTEYDRTVRTDMERDRPDMERPRTEHDRTVRTDQDQDRTEFDRDRTDMERPRTDMAHDRTDLDRARTDMDRDRTWKRHYVEIDSLLTNLLMPEIPAPVGTTGVHPGVTEPGVQPYAQPGLERGVQVDQDVRQQLQQVWMHLHRFNAAAETPGIERAPQAHDAAPGVTRTPDVTMTDERPVTERPRVPEHDPQAPQAQRPDAQYPTAQRPHTPERETRVDQDTLARTDDPEYHLDRIRELVNQALAPAPDRAPAPRPDQPVGTTGLTEMHQQVTIDRATLEQIRSHVEQLRQAIDNGKEDRGETERMPRQQPYQR